MLGACQSETPVRMAASVSGGGNPFLGGGEQRNLAPTAVGGAIGSANTRVSAPVAGVAPTQIKSARPNQGSNIGIPYTRLVPLNGSMQLIEFGDDKDKIPKTRTETEDLRPRTLAFILGKRGKTHTTHAEHVHNVAYQPAIMPGMPGTERFQQLCSIEYLKLYFERVIQTKRCINLNVPMKEVINDISENHKGAGGLIADYNASVKFAEGIAAGHGADHINIPELDEGDCMLKCCDLAKRSGCKDSIADKEGENLQGIFARDFGPFLKGKGTATKLVSCTGPTSAGESKHRASYKTTMSRNAGDDLAFSVLDALLMEAGCTDWRPDGIVLSKGVNDPSDKMSDEYLEARDGQLYNIRVQGPAVSSSWAGERSMETLPLDKVFVVIVADVWFDPSPADVESMKGMTNEQYFTWREERLATDPLNETTFKERQQEAFKGDEEKRENTHLFNFRVQMSTSSQMINHSNYNDTANSHTARNGNKRSRLEGSSRMGLKLCNSFGEYIVGGWQIGNVLDTSASRAVMPSGSNIGVRTAPNSAALSVNVNVSWYTADRMCRAFNNPEGKVRTRYAPPQTPCDNPVNKQLNATEFSSQYKKSG